MGKTIEDSAVIVEDYTKLPVHSSFWETCFRKIDAAGTHSQLRYERRIIDVAVDKIYERTLGSVISADDQYESLAQEMVNTGLLLRDLNERIIQLGRINGANAQRICGLVLLIGKLTREASADIGLRSTKDHVADRLIDDLFADNGKLARKSRTG